MNRWIVLLIFFISHIDAAAPATHVYFAIQWMNHHEISDPQSFIAGTLFPDIRYLGTISRSETHDKHVSARSIIRTDNSFTAGKKLHAFVDVKRENFVKKSKICSYLKGIPKKHQTLFLKLLEDEILWDHIKETPINQALQPIYIEEVNHGLDRSTILQWHQEMKEYLKQRPSEFLSHLAKNNQSFLKVNSKTINVWSQILPIYASNPIFIAYTQDLTSHLEKKINLFD